MQSEFRASRDLRDPGSSIEAGVVPRPGARRPASGLGRGAVAGGVVERLEVGLPVGVEPGQESNPLLGRLELCVAALQQTDPALVPGEALLQSRAPVL